MTHGSVQKAGKVRNSTPKVERKHHLSRSPRTTKKKVIFTNYSPFIYTLTTLLIYYSLIFNDFRRKFLVGNRFENT
ncbi:MAG: 30S ribosomal protein S30e [Candidatus Heimdallarchaeota archaeon]